MAKIFWGKKKKKEKKVEILGSREALKNKVQQQIRVSHVQKNLLAATQSRLIASYAGSHRHLSI